MISECMHCGFEDETALVVIDGICLNCLNKRLVNEFKTTTVLPDAEISMMVSEIFAKFDEHSILYVKDEDA